MLNIHVITSIKLNSLQSDLLFVIIIESFRDILIFLLCFYPLCVFI